MCRGARWNVCIGRSRPFSRKIHRKRSGPLVRLVPTCTGAPQFVRRYPGMYNGMRAIRMCAGGLGKVPTSGDPGPFSGKYPLKGPDHLRDLYPLVLGHPNLYPGTKPCKRRFGLPEHMEWGSVARLHRESPAFLEENSRKMPCATRAICAHLYGDTPICVHWPGAVEIGKGYHNM
jgi:hypothetical protein